MSRPVTSWALVGPILARIIDKPAPWMRAETHRAAVRLLDLLHNDARRLIATAPSLDAAARDLGLSRSTLLAARTDGWLSDEPTPTPTPKP